MAVISNLIARLRADTASFDRKMNKSRQHITRFGKDVQRMGRQMLAFAGVGGGLYAVKRGLGAITRAAMEQEKVERALSAAVKGSITQFKTYAAAMQKITVYGDEEILSQMAYAKNLGVTTDKLQEAATAAIGLAARFRIDLASAMMLVGRASQGQTQMLTRYGIAIDQTLPDQEKFIRLLKIGAESLRLAKEEARTSAGAFTQFKNAAGDLAEVIGEPFLDTMAKDAKRAKTNIEILTEAIKKQRKAVEEAIKTEGRLKYMPIGMPFAVPRVSKDIFEKPKTPIPESLGRKPPFILAAEELDKEVKKRQEEQAAIKKSVDEIRSKYIPAIRNEIELTGKLSEARAHARQMSKLENDLKAESLDKTKYGIALMKEQKFMLKELEGAQRLARIADSVGDAFGRAFERAIFDAEKLREVMKALMRDIAMAVVRQSIIEPFARGISGVISGMFAKGALASAPVQPPGQTVFAYPSGHRGIPADFMPRLHGGLRSDEFPAIIQRGEEIIPKAAAGRSQMPAVNIVINNESGVPLRQRGNPIMERDKIVIFIEAELNDRIQRNAGPLRNTIENLK